MQQFERIPEIPRDQPAPCLYSRNISFLIESEESKGEVSETLKEHIKECELCQRTYKDFISFNNTIKKNIVSKVLTGNERDQFLEEIDSIVKDGVIFIEDKHDFDKSYFKEAAKDFSFILKEKKWLILATILAIWTYQSFS